MSNEIATFDYDGIDKDTKNKLINLAGQFNSKMKGYKQSWLDLGEIVSHAHELLAIDGRDGKFGKWIEANLNVSRQTAYRYMWAWERFGNCNSVLQFTTEALYELSGPNVPEKAVKEAIKLADKGKVVTKSVAGDLTEKHTVNSTAADPSPQRAPTSVPQIQAQAKQAVRELESIDAVADNCDHDFDEEACKKCHLPRPVAIYNDAFDATTPESKDHFGNDVPDELAQVFALRKEFEEQCDKLKSIQTWITQRLSHPGAAILQSSEQRLRSDDKHASTELKYAAPYCVCVYCKNKPPKVANCNACKGLGWITEPIFKAAPESMRRESKRSA